MTAYLPEAAIPAVEIGTANFNSTSDMQIAVPQGQPISASDEDIGSSEELLQQSEDEAAQNLPLIADALMSLQAVQALAFVTLGVEPASKDESSRKKLAEDSE